MHQPASSTRSLRERRFRCASYRDVNWTRLNFQARWWCAEKWAKHLQVLARPFIFFFLRNVSLIVCSTGPVAIFSFHVAKERWKSCKCRKRGRHVVEPGAHAKNLLVTWYCYCTLSFKFGSNKSMFKLLWSRTIGKSNWMPLGLIYVLVYEGPRDYLLKGASHRARPYFT